MRILTNSMMEASITNLEPGREYEFMVLSQDRYGDGMFSKTFKYFTKRKLDKPNRLLRSKLINPLQSYS